jgi:hypothetical protein
MRILFDQGTPVPLGALLKKHSVTTVYELGWSQLQNGEPLKQAEGAGYEALVTTDQNLRYQQNLRERRIAVAILMATSWPRIDRHAPHVVARIDGLQVGAFVEIAIP